MMSARDAAVLKVETARSTYLKPQKSIGRNVVQLITFDLRCLFYKYIQFLMVYRNIGDFNEVEEKLKDGLRSVLEDYFPLAGKLVTDVKGLLHVEYDDYMDGAELKIAYAEDVHVDDMMVGNKVSRYEEFLPYNRVANFEGFNRPLLCVQLTKLKDGFALGCALNHGVVDGASTWHFLKAWAEKCCGSTHISVKPFHDRTKARNTCVKIDIPSTSKDKEIVTVAPPPLSQRVFPFSGLTVNKIKSDANQHRTNGKPYSTFQCVAAHVWHAITRARRLMPEDITELVMVANSRRRIDPPVPESYFGNLVTFPFTSTTSGVLFTSPPGTAASMIQKAIETHDSYDIDQAAKRWEKNPRPFNPLEFNNLVCFGSSPRFEFYKLDFGWGMPKKVWCGANNRIDGSVFLNQGNNGDGSIDVDITLKDHVMKRLEMDKEFLMQQG